MTVQRRPAPGVKPACPLPAEALRNDELTLENEALRTSMQRYENMAQELYTLFNTAPIGLMTVDANGVIIKTNATLAAILGLAPEHLEGRPFIVHLEPVDHAAFFHCLRHHDHDSSEAGCVLQLKSDGTPRYIDFRINVIIEEQDSAARIHPPAQEQDEDLALALCAIVDISALKQYERQLLEEHERYQLISENVRDVVFSLDERFRFRYLSPSLDFHFPGLRMLPQWTIWRRLLHRVENRETLLQVKRHMQLLLDSGVRADFSIECDVEARDEHGARTVLEVVLSCHFREGVFEGVVGVAREITRRVELEESLRAANEKLHRLATEDQQLGVTNRYLLDQLYTAAHTAAVASGEPLAVVLIDLDHFKQVNDTFGHLVGDIVLKRMARLLFDEKPPDCHFGRWGGEEFLLICPGWLVEEAHELAESMRRRLEALPHPEMSGAVTASFGVAALREDETLSQLLTRADDALYAAKAQGRNTTALG